MCCFGASSLAPGTKRSLPAAIRGVIRMPRFGAIALVDDNRSVAGVNLGHLWDETAMLVPQFETIVSHAAAGRVRPVIDETFDLDATTAEERKETILDLTGGRGEIALVVAAEKMSSIVDWDDRSTCVLFGDGGGAAVVRRADNGRGVLSSYLRSDGQLAHLLHRPAPYPFWSWPVVLGTVGGLALLAARHWFRHGLILEDRIAEVAERADARWLKKSGFPVTRSSNRAPTLIMTSQWYIARLAS